MLDGMTITIGPEEKVDYLQICRLVLKENKLEVFTEFHAPGQFDTLVFKDFRGADEAFKTLIS